MNQSIALSNRVKLNARFHQLIGEHGLDKEDKMSVVSQVSNGRETSSSKLSNIELAEAIRLLNSRRQESLKRMRAKAINLAKDCGFLPDRIISTENWKGLNTWCEKTFKKPFYKLDYNELRNCVTGLERVLDSKQNQQIKSALS